MEIGTKRPVAPPPVPATLPARQPDPVRAPAPVGRAAPVSDEGGRRPAALSDVISRHLEIDPATRQVVFQALNARGEVVLQVPDQVILRVRAYDAEARAADARAAAAGSLVVRVA